MKLIKATDDQIKEMARLACLASCPIGMGFVHYKKDETFPKEVFKLENEGNQEYDMNAKWRGNRKELNLDYVQGRMVKLYMREVEPGLWSSPQLNHVSSEYQSWVEKYPTLEDLVKAAGAEVITREEPEIPEVELKIQDEVKPEDERPFVGF